MKENCSTLLQKAAKRGWLPKAGLARLNGCSQGAQIFVEGHPGSWSRVSARLQPRSMSPRSACVFLFWACLFVALFIETQCSCCWQCVGTETYFISPNQCHETMVITLLWSVDHLPLPPTVMPL